VEISRLSCIKNGPNARKILQKGNKYFPLVTMESKLKKKIIAFKKQSDG
jgi:hypothetical protein